MLNSLSAAAARVRVPAGFLLAATFLFFAQPTPTALAAGAAVAFLGLLLRAWSSGYIEKNQKLSTAGPYAYTRNPLYVGSAIAGVGFAIAAGRWWFVLLVVVFLLALYWPVIRREENYLRSIFPGEYLGYAKAVPALLPRLKPWRPPSGDSTRFRWARYWRNREYQALLAYLVLLSGLFVRMWIERAN